MVIEEVVGTVVGRAERAEKKRERQRERRQRTGTKWRMRSGVAVEG
jgi:hypothetical protein